MITYRSTQYHTPFESVVRPLRPDEYAELRADIIARGVVVPVIVDEECNIIDGHHRLKIAAELGLADVPIETRGGMTDEEKQSLAWDLNAHRRQLSAEERREAARRLRAQGKSTRQIADDLDIGLGTAHRYVNSGVPFGTPEPDTVTGADGKTYPARKPPRPAPPLTPEQQQDVAETMALMQRAAEQERAQRLGLAHADWLAAPDANEVLQGLKSWQNDLAAYRKTTALGKFSPEAYGFLALRLRNFMTELETWLDEVEQYEQRAA